MSDRLSPEEIEDLAETWKLYGGEAECCCMGKIPRLLAELRLVTRERDEARAALESQALATEKGRELIGPWIVENERLRAKLAALGGPSATKGECPTGPDQKESS